MIRNYLLIALRNLRKYKATSFINIFGLTVGLTCCLVILCYVLNETNYDNYSAKASQVYRVTRTFYNQDGAANLRLSAVAPPYGPLLKHEFPDVQEVTRVLPNGLTAVHYKDKLFNEQGVFFADEKVFDFFPTQVVKGSAAKSLENPQSVMLTPAIAKKYFGDEDPMNKMVKLDNQLLCKVTGIFQPFPANAHMHPEIMVSFSTLLDSAIYGRQQLETNFGNNAFYTYLMLPKGYPAESIKARFPSFIDKVMPIPQGANVPPGFKQSKFTSLDLEKLTDIHLYSHLDDEIEPPGDIKRVYIFSAIALFILLIACINYMNLSSARSILRAREIGVRKVVGAQRKEIILQFLSESVLITWLALALAVLASWLLLPYINKLSGLNLSLNSLSTAAILVPLLLLPFAVGIISGIYPALFMSSFKPIKVLKGLVKTGGGSVSFRQVLVVLQFGISIVLIIATTIVFQQLRYMQKSSLGYDKEHIITMPYNSGLADKFDAFRNTLLQNTQIKNVGRSSRIPTGRLLDSQGSSVMSGDSLVPTTAVIKNISADYYFIPTYGIQMAAGRNFSKEYATDSTGYIINETAVSMLGWKSADKAVGQILQYGGVKGRIIGVMKDFHFESMHQQIIPMVLYMPNANNGGFGNLSIKLAGDDVQAALSSVEKTWHTFLPETPFQYTFLNERFNKMYAAETQQGSLFTIFSGIAIFIACLGLFALSAFIITQRVKEIGIRKVLGATPGEIVKVLSVDFLKLVIIAAVIAIPVAAYAMHEWLQNNFAYHITMAWGVFIAAALLAAMIALATISFQTIKAALANPVKSLRTE